MKILVVDDSRIMRTIVKNSILKHDKYVYEFLEASNGLDALKIIKEEKIDLLLLDWNMPQLNGVDLVIELRSEEKYSTLPIIMITSEAAKYNVIEAVKAGVNDYLIKPVNDTRLMEKIDQVLQNIGQEI